MYGAPWVSAHITCLEHKTQKGKKRAFGIDMCTHRNQRACHRSALRRLLLCQVAHTTRFPCFLPVPSLSRLTLFFHDEGHVLTRCMSFAPSCDTQTLTDKDCSAPCTPVAAPNRLSCTGKCDHELRCKTLPAYNYEQGPAMFGIGGPTCLAFYTSHFQ